MVIGPVADPAGAQPAPAGSAGEGQASAEQQDAGDERRELVDRRTSHAKVFQNPDGTMTAVVHPDPVHFKDTQGKWREIDTTLEACPSDTRCAYQNRSGPYSARFASSAAAEEVLAIHDRALKVGFGFEGARAAEPVVDGNRITYPDAQPGVDLTFDVAPGEVKESIVLTEAPTEPPTFRFPIRTTNLTAEQRESGEIVFVDERGEVQFTVPRMFMFDSSGDEQTREPALSEDVVQDVEGSGRRQTLTIRPDPEWLSDPDRVYPVTVDPTVTKTPSLDTFVQSNILNTSQAGSVELKAGTYDGGGTKARSLVKFPIGFLDGTVVDTAKLSLFNNHSWSCSDRRVQVFRVTDDWGSGVTWPNKPGFGANAVDGVVAAKGYSGSCPSGRIEFGVADLVKQWKNGTYPNYGFGIRAENEADNYGWKKFASNEAGHPPELIVNFDTPPLKPLDLSPPCPTTSADLSPRLSAQYRDPDAGDGGHLEFEVFTDPDGDGVYDNLVRWGTGDFAEPGQRSGWTPGNPLNEGIRYRWRARANDGKEVSEWTDSGGADKCPYIVQVDPPGAPTISSTSHPDPNAWVRDASPVFTWTQPSDSSGINGYSWSLTQSASTIPDQVVNTLPNGERRVSFSGVASGEWWFHVRARDGSGEWGVTAHRKVRIDVTAPKLPVISSSTHQNPASAYEEDDIEFSWTKPFAYSGIDGYSWVLDSNALTEPDTQPETSLQTLRRDDVGWGIFYLHVRAKGGTGIWGPTAHFKISIHPMARATLFKLEAPGGLMTEVPAPDPVAVPDLVEPPLGGLSDLLPSGGLLGEGPIFEGDLLPLENPAEEVTDTFAVMAPPDPPLPDVGPLAEETGELFTTFEDLPAPGPFDLIDAATYQVQTIAFAADGSQTNVRNDEFPICIPHKYNSKNDDPAVPGDTPADPLALHDLRINLCPDPASLEPGAPQKLTYDLDALENGVHVEVIVTYAALGKRLHLDTLARNVDHPNDFQLQLSSEGTAAAGTRNVLDSTSSGRLQEVRLRLDRETSSGFEREGRVTINNLPARVDADQRHRYVLEGREATAADRTQRLRAQLESSIPNPNESLVLESFDPDDAGKLTARVKFDGIPVRFDKTLTTDVAAGAPLDRARPDRVTITGTQPADADETLVAEQWNGERLLGRGTVTSFASAYTYEVAVIRDAANRESGVRFSGEFPEGRPADGSFRLARMRHNQTNDQDELDALLQIDHFSRSTTERIEVIRNTEGRAVGAEFNGTFADNPPPGGRFKLARFRLDDASTDDERKDLFEINHFATSTRVVTRVDGSAGNPTGLHVNVTNAEAVPQQLVEVLRTPATGRRSRLILAGSNADEALIAPQVHGSNLRWDAIPRTFDFDITVARQDNGLPSRLSLTNVSSNAPDAGRIKLTQDGPNSTLGLIVKAPTVDQSIVVRFEGTLSKPRLARVSRVNNQDQPNAALQFFQQSDSGLVSELRFMGPTATGDGLVGGTPSKIEGIGRDVPNRFDYGVELQRNGDGFPSDAVISGSNGSFTRPMDVVLIDHQRDFRLEQRSFPATYTYSIRARDFDSAGRPRRAIISGDQSADNGAGRIDLSYRGMRFLMDSLTRVFDFEVSVEGPLNNPTGAVLSQTQSSANENQVVQLVRRGANGPRAALTIRNAPPILAEDASSTDLIWTTVPQDYVLRLSRDEAGSGGERIGLNGNLMGSDKPGSVLRLGAVRGGQRQELRLEGLAPRWATRLRYEGSLPNPRELVVDVASTARHTSDLIKLRNFDAGDLTHRLVMRGNADEDVSGDNPRKVDAVMTSITEAFVLRYKRVRDSVGDVSQVVDLTNQRVLTGIDDRETRPNLDGVLNVEMRNNGARSENVWLEDLPAHFRMAYDRPPVTTDGRENCLGRLGFNATAATLDLKIRAFLNRGCAHGKLLADVDDMPTQGFSVAKIHSDGNGRISVANGETIPKMTVKMPAPDDLRQFVNKDIHIDQQFCKPFIFELGCSHIKVDANPQFENLRLDVTMRQLRDVRIATNAGSNGQADPYPGSSDRKEDHTLWETAPILAVRNGSGGAISAELTGRDDTGQRNNLHQEIQCCTKPVKTANGSMDYSLDREMRARFYFWYVKQGSCAGASGSGPDAVKCNSNGEELRDDFGQNMHCGFFGFEEPVPFPPRFNAAGSWNRFSAAPGETMYFVPNPHDISLSEPAGEDTVYRWYARNAMQTCQTDWFYASMLREYEPDLLGGALNAL